MALRLGRYFWKLFIVNAALMAFVIAGCVWVIVAQLDRLREEELSQHLYVQASALEAAVRDRFDIAHAPELSALASRVGSTELEGIRVTFILTDGTVIGDSDANPTMMESHADRPEIKQALAEGFGQSVRWSHTVAKNMRYAALRVGPADAPDGVVRVSKAVQSITARAAPTQRLVLFMVLFSVLAAIILAMALALLWSRRIRRIMEAARSISQGDLSARVEVVGHDEIAELSRSLNNMREKLSSHLDTIDRQRRTLDSLVSQLGEGVVVVDAHGRIELINSEAIELLQIAPNKPDKSYLGLTIEQCVPQRKLQDMLHSVEHNTPTDITHLTANTISGPDSLSVTKTQDVELQIATQTDERTVLARAFEVRLPGSVSEEPSHDHGEHIGRALLLTDVTELTRVLRVKADLAANASHELRTPLSAIRVAVDTLRSIDPQVDPANVSQFVDVIDRHSRRMEAMIGDLIDLSRLESGANRFKNTRISAKTFMEELRCMFADALAVKNLNWKTAVHGEQVTFTTISELLRMILRNLIDNAIKFTDNNGDITLTVRSADGSLTFEVADTGRGIAPEDQQRVFERFYQVQRARSGPDRGTGLGLSIVRHAAMALGATIDLQSTLGQGTCVTVRLPNLK